MRATAFNRKWRVKLPHVPAASAGKTMSVNTGLPKPCPRPSVSRELPMVKTIDANLSLPISRLATDL